MLRLGGEWRSVGPRRAGSQAMSPQLSGQLARLRYPGGIDADGHVLEPPDLWERYLEPRYRERALRIRKDPGPAEIRVDVVRPR